MERYREAGTERALALGNRGPVSFDDAGKLDSTIVEAYSRCGFYVFEGVLEEEELADIERDVAHILERAPVTRSAKLDSQGRPALGIDCEARNLHWVRPLSDPVGGTNAAHGRHPAKMTELAPPIGAPEHVVQVVLGSLQFSDACLRVYGHPELLAVGIVLDCGYIFISGCTCAESRDVGVPVIICDHRIGSVFIVAGAVIEGSP